MRRIFVAPCLLLLLACAPAVAESPAAGPVTVVFVAPEKFTDAWYGPGRSHRGDNRVLDQLRRFLERRAPRYLAPGQQLQLRFTDIDLAGDFEPGADPDLFEVRIVRGVYPPRLRFDYELRDAGGALLRGGPVDLRDLGFDAASTGNPSDPLRYEKRMLLKWLAAELGPAR